MRTSASTHLTTRRLGIPMLVGALTVGALMAFSATAGASTPAKPAAATVRAKVFEFQIKPKPTTVAKGTVRFAVTNIGTEKHEFVVVKTDGSPLPTLADGSVDEEKIPESDKYGEVENLKPKKSGSLTVKSLPAGDYVAFCNIVDDMGGTTMVHYAQGMHAEFTVS
jgi:uncharacterized cupredoxin-like copper-binding protein